MTTLELLQVPCDEHGYPNIEFPDEAAHLLFDFGYSYGLLQENEHIVEALLAALRSHESEGSPANKLLDERLGAILGRMKNFTKRRMAVDEVFYRAAYVMGAGLQKRFEQMTKGPAAG